MTELGGGGPVRGRVGVNLFKTYAACGHFGKGTSLRWEMYARALQQLGGMHVG